MIVKYNIEIWEGGRVKNKSERGKDRERRGDEMFGGEKGVNKMRRLFDKVCGVVTNGQTAC